jgi:hypothetical protein
MLFGFYGNFQGSLPGLPPPGDAHRWAGLIEIARRRDGAGRLEVVARLTPRDAPDTAVESSWFVVTPNTGADGVFLFEHGTENGDLAVALPTSLSSRFRKKDKDPPLPIASGFSFDAALNLQIALIVPTAVTPRADTIESPRPLVLSLSYTSQALVGNSWPAAEKTALNGWDRRGAAFTLPLPNDFLFGPIKVPKAVRNSLIEPLRDSLVLPGVGRDLSLFGADDLSDAASANLPLFIDKVPGDDAASFPHAWHVGFALKGPGFLREGRAVGADITGFRFTLPGTEEIVKGKHRFKTDTQRLEAHTTLATSDPSNRWTALMAVDTRLAWLQRDDSAIGYVLASAFDSIDAARSSLHDTEPEQPQSFLPSLVRSPALTPVALALYAKHLCATPREGLWSVANADSPLEGFRMSISHVPISKDGIGKAPILTAELPSFLIRTSGGAKDLSVRLAHDPQVQSSSADPYLFNFRLEPVEEKALRDYVGRLGGLSFSAHVDPASPQQQHRRALLQSDGADANFYSHLRFGRNEELVEQPSSSRDWVKTDVDLNLRLRFDTALPVGVDVERGDRTGRAAPILIDLNAADGQARAFILTARETIGPRRDRQLVATLSDIDSLPANQIMLDGVNSEAGEDLAVAARPAPIDRRGQYVLIGTEPFSILKVYSEPLSERGDQQTVEVAVYDSDIRRWQLKVSSRTYQYALPPQGVGESADKPRRLEIMDPVPGAADENWPYPRNDTGDNAPLRYRNVEFRLTPSAELWITPSDLERSYFDPEWAARDIFRQQGDFGIGAELAGFRGEFLYGLMVSVDPSKEKGAAARARVAEIEALTGRPPVAPRASQVDATYGERWLKLSTALTRRPERLEFWNRGTTEQKKAIASSHFREGAAFALRNTALHRPAVALLEHSPVEAPNQPFPGPSSPRLHAKGLSGGALWPIESKNVYESLLREPASTGGYVENIALSPVGGDADQRAEFRNGIVAIISETRNGFIQRQQVEVLGRVGAWWNRAKHVVVYERTTSPSAQFTPEGGIKQRSRRPILRKVSEYIEFLDQTRRFPDFDDVSPRTVGFMEALSFHKIIPVDSAWSHDVGDYGWTIPLWNPQAAAQRPQVYPRPFAGFTTTAEGEGERANVTQECLNPHNLFFYTDTKTNNPDTNSWPAIVGIDLANLPFPKHVGKKLKEVAGPGPDAASQAPASRIPRGYHKFTWLLAPAAHRTAMNAARADKPVYAGLETVTFTRAAKVDTAPPGALAGFLESSISVGKKTNERSHWGKGWSAANPPPIQLTAPLGAIFTDFSNFKTALASGVPGDIVGTAQQLAATLRNTGGHAQILTDLVDSAGIDDALKLTSVGDLADKGKARCDELAGDLIGGIRRKKLLLLEQIRSWHAEFDSYLDGVGNAPPFSLSKTELIANIESGVDKALTPLFDGAAEQIGSVTASVDNARNVVRELQLAFQRTAAAARTDVLEFSASYDRSKPWSPARLTEFHNRVADCASRFSHNLQSEMDDARARLIVQTDDLAQQLSDFLARWLKDLAAGRKQFEVNLDRVATLLQDRVASVAVPVAKLVPASGTGQLDAVVAKLVAIRAELTDQAQLAAADAVIEKCRQLKAVVGAARANLNALSAAISKNQQNAEMALATANAAAQGLVSRINAVADEVRQFLVQVSADIEEDLLNEASTALGEIAAFVQNIPTALAELDEVKTFTAAADKIVASIVGEITSRGNALEGQINSGFDLISVIGEDISDGLASTAKLLAPANILRTIIIPKVLDPTLRKLVEPLPETIDKPPQLADLRSQLDRLAAAFSQALDELDSDAAGVITTVQDACAGLATTIKDAQQYLANVAGSLKDHVKQEIAKQFASLNDRLGPLLNDANELIAAADRLDADFRKIANDLTRSAEMAEAYGERVIDAAGNITKGGIMAAPSNILKLAAAAASVPDLPGLDFARERLGYYYDAVNDLIDTTPAEAWFGKLGDQFKAIGLNFPFQQIGDGLKAPDLSEYGIGRVLDSFGALKLRDLWRYSGLPLNAREAIKLTNDFDKKAMRAWVRIDINLPLPGRRSLFAIGPFKLDFVDSRFVGQVMIEASKDTDTVKQTGSATLHTNIDAVVSGQSMVRLDKVAVNYSQDAGLKVDFDPKNIKLNEIFRFIQDTLGSIFPDEVGGLKLIKQSGIPVGIEHEFSMPPIDLMFGTSGVTNIQINNKFQLIAYPEFVIADRFSLSRPELPFIFSIFILGGTGYIWLETQYRPFTKGGGELLVMVEAAAGAAASLGFAFAGISGSVSITLSAALTYRKLIGSSGGGLGISLVLVILGNVSIFGIATVYIGLVLRLSYRDNGQVDAYGSLTVTIRISRFFKITAHADVRYVMRDGQSSTKTVTSVQSSANADLNNAKKLLAATA